MINKYLMIENPGVAPIEGFTLAGATNKGPDSPRLIGCFGTGTKESAFMLMRGGRYPIVYCGKDKIEWHTRGKMIEGKEHMEVFFSVNGKAPKSTQCTINKGRLDWDSDWMAVREYVSNALDAVDGDHTKVTVRLVEPGQVRAAAGKTRVFIPHWQGDVQEMLDKLFLHWRGIGDPYQAMVIDKPVPGPVKFYRRGVLIREVANESSMFDYNFADMKIDEARKADWWTLLHQAGVLVSRSVKGFGAVVRKMSAGDGLGVEGKFSQYSLRPTAEVLAEVVKDAVVVNTKADADFAKHKGLPSSQVLVLNEAFTQAIHGEGVGKIEDRFGSLAKMGLVDAAPGEEMLAETDRLMEKWLGLVGKAGLGYPADDLRSQVNVKFFAQHPGSNRQLYGQCVFTGPDQGIWLNAELGGELLEQTIVEELAHWFSGSMDFTREFQEWLVRLMVRVTE